MHANAHTHTHHVRPKIRIQVHSFLTQCFLPAASMEQPQMATLGSSEHHFLQAWDSKSLLQKNLPLQVRLSQEPLLFVCSSDSIVYIPAAGNNPQEGMKPPKFPLGDSEPKGRVLESKTTLHTWCSAGRDTWLEDFCVSEGNPYSPIADVTPRPVSTSDYGTCPSWVLSPALCEEPPEPQG